MAVHKTLTQKTQKQKAVTPKSAAFAKATTKVAASKKTAGNAQPSLNAKPVSKAKPILKAVAQKTSTTKKSTTPVVAKATATASNKKLTSQKPATPTAKATLSKADASKTAKTTPHKKSAFSSIEKGFHAAEEQSEKLINSVTEVARSLKSKAKEAIGNVEKAAGKVSGRATQALRSVEAAIDARKTDSRKTDSEETSTQPEIHNLVQKIKAGSGAEITELEELTDDDTTEVGEATTKAKKLQVFRSRAERLKVERLISDNHQPVQKRWAAIHDQLKHLKASAYDMTGQFDLKTPVVHKVLGWGFIVDIRDGRMDVMFKDGLKTLIMNYKR